MSRQNSRDVSSLEVTLNGSQIEIDPIGNGTRPFDDVKVLLVKGQDGVGSPYTDTPSMDGTGDAGSSALYSRGDHVHPSDTSRQPTTLTTPITINGTEQTTVEGALGTIPTAMFKGVDYVTAGKGSNTTLGTGATAEGQNNNASGNYCHCEGGSNKASAAYAHCEGQSGQATANNAHCEGVSGKATAAAAHCEGGGCEAAGSSSHAEGESTKALNQASHSEGSYTRTGCDYQHVQGRYNVGNFYNAFEVGNGSGNNARSDIFEVGWDGGTRATGKIMSVLERTTLEANVAKSAIVTLQIDVSASGAVTATMTDKNSTQYVYGYSLRNGHTGCFVSVYQTNNNSNQGTVYIPLGSSYTYSWSASGLNITATFESFKASVIGEDIVDSHNIKLSDAQLQSLSSAVTISGSSQTTVEGAIGALAGAVNSIPSVYKPSGDKTCAELTSSLLIAANVGNVYNTTDSGTTTSDFVGGSGKPINIGDNVAVVNTGTDVSPVYKFDLMAGFIDTSNFVQKSSTSGLLKNDGTVDTNSYALASTVNGILDGTSIDSFSDVESALSDKVATTDLPTATVGSANELNTATPTASASSYIKRQTSGNLERIKKIVGASVVWNQLVNTNTSSVTITSGHKYVAKISGTLSVGQSTGAAISVTGGTDTLTDLTQMFGSTIADYIYTLEQTEAGSGIAWLESYGFDLSTYHAYDAGSIQSVCVSGKKSVGKNRLPKFYNGSLNGVNFSVDLDGVVTVNGTASATTNWAINLSGFEGTFTLTGCPSGGGSSSYQLWVYDVTNETSLNKSDTGSGATDIVLHKDITYSFRIRVASGYTMNNVVFKPMLRYADITDDTFEPYRSVTYPLSPTQLRGLFKLDSNTLYADGDEYTADGSEKVTYGLLNLGNVNWTKMDSSYQYGTFSVEVSTPYYNADEVYWLSDYYNSVCTNNGTTSSGDNYIWIRETYASVTRDYIVIKDTSKASMTEAEFKTAMSGKYFVFKKKTASQTTAQLTPYSEYQTIYPNGTEEWIDGLTRDFTVPVYNDIETFVSNSKSIIAEDDVFDGYGNWLRKKADLDEIIALLGDDESGNTKASRAYSVNEFFYKDGNIYKCLTSIASGATFTVGTNCTQTTIFAVLTALLNA